MTAMRFRFTIRDLLWLTSVVALDVGWWLDHRQSAEQSVRYLQTIHGYQFELEKYRPRPEGDN